MFKKVLVANRGEIAVQVIRNLHEMAIEAVAVYSTADRDAYFVELADEAVCIGAPLPEQSYLDMKSIVTVACLLGCDAVHPGYGFLSENAEFVVLCQEVGLTFIGPQSETVALMGDKASAREVMQAAGVPVIPGSDGTISDLNAALTLAEKIGYPVMLKSAAGGGGKGMRRVDDKAALTVAFEDVKRESQLSFGETGIYLEKVIEHAKHIEMQVIADDFGHVVYFPERDCSPQRHHQKLVEESPSSLISAERRAELGAIVVKACQSVNYRNTGTFEFLMDPDQRFYFMEMNTRLQVEHTVSEEVTGVEMIKAQVLVAAHQPLPFDQADVQVTQFAVECRINAENPAAQFMPAAGDVTGLFLPVGAHGVRIDTGLREVDTISPYYDSMIAKLVTSGSNRAAALKKMQRLLTELKVTGLTTNQAFLVDLVASPEFVADEVTIESVEQTILPRWLDDASKV